MTTERQTPPTDYLVVRFGSITAANPDGTVAITVDGAAIDSAPIVASVTPLVGVPVVVLQSRYSVIIIGSTDPATRYPLEPTPHERPN